MAVAWEEVLDHNSYLWEQKFLEILDKNVLKKNWKVGGMHVPYINSQLQSQMIVLDKL